MAQYIRPQRFPELQGRSRVRRRSGHGPRGRKQADFSRFQQQLFQQQGRVRPDRRSDPVSAPFKPERVAAIVVGIDEYAFKEQNWDRKGPATHALEFLNLLTKAGVGAIYLFLSAKPDE